MQHDVSTRTPRVNFSAGRVQPKGRIHVVCFPSSAARRLRRGAAAHCRHLVRRHTRSPGRGACRHCRLGRGRSHDRHRRRRPYLPRRHRAVRHDPAQSRHGHAGLQARIQVGGRLSLRGPQHPRLLTHAFFRQRALRPGRRAVDAGRGQATARPRRSRPAWQRLPLRVQPRQRSGATRLLRGDARHQRRARGAHRGPARWLAPLHLSQGPAGTRTAGPAAQHLRLPGQGVVVAVAGGGRWHRHRLP